MSHNQQDFATRIRQLGYRMTPQRQLVLDVICESKGRATMREICAQVNERSPVVDRTTVYRTVSMLHENGMIDSAEINGRLVWEIADESPHHHLICRACGAVIDFGDDHLTPLVDHIISQHDFHPELRHLTIQGVCNRCQNAAESDDDDVD